MSDYHAKQFDGGPTACDSRNCAAASCAMAIAAGTGYKTRLTSDMVRTQSGVSCVPGVHSNSGGLFISDVIRVAAANGVTIDYGGPRRWPESELEGRLRLAQGAVLLGDYDALNPRNLRASSTFLGDHSVWVHGFRVVDGQKQIHWHDPLRADGMWIGLTSALGYWQKAGSPVQGLAGFVKVIEVENDMAVIYATPGRTRVQVKLGTPYYGSPGDASALGTINNASSWFDEAAFAAKADRSLDSSWVALDGLSPTSATTPAPMGWIRSANVSRRETIPTADPAMKAELDRVKADLSVALTKISAAKSALA